MGCPKEFIKTIKYNQEDILINYFNLIFDKPIYIPLRILREHNKQAFNKICEVKENE